MDCAVDLGPITLWPLPRSSATGRARHRLSTSPRHVLSRRLDIDDGRHDVADGPPTAGKIPPIDRAARGSFTAFGASHRRLLGRMARSRYRRPRRLLVGA